MFRNCSKDLISSVRHEKGIVWSATRYVCMYCKCCKMDSYVCMYFAAIFLHTGMVRPSEET